jgi:ABC-type lipoprotein release transport system permease subunit
VKIPFSYVFRNLWTRKLTTLLTAGGMALVVFVFAAVLMLDAGLKKTLVSTGSPENAILLRQSAQTEIQSSITRDQASLVQTLPGVARDQAGEPMVSREILVLAQIPAKGGGRPANVVIRGLPALGLAMRPQVRLLSGRMFRPGTSEIVVGKGISEGFDGVDIGQSQRFAQREWTVVGVFDGGGSAYDSEVWGDVEQMMQAYRRTTFSSAIARLESPGEFDAFVTRVAGQQRLTLDVKREPLFYAEQSRQLSNFISILGMILSAIFSIGAMIGAMITMYAAVSNRTGEIGTLRAARLPPLVHPRGVPARVRAAGAGRRHRRPRPRLRAAGLYHHDHELAVLLAARLRLPPHARHRHGDARVLGPHGARGWLPAERAGGAAGDRRFAESRVMETGGALAFFRRLTEATNVVRQSHSATASHRADRIT